MKYARIERERRFLLARSPAGLDLDAGYRELDDLYLESSSLRLRAARAADGSILELKLSQKQASPSGPAHCVITSLYLSPTEYELLSRLPGRRLCKRRHRHVDAGIRFGIDVFRGALAGLVLAEAEAASDEELWSYPLPAFAQVEVTELLEFTGGALASAEPASVLRRAHELLARPA